MGFFRFDFVRIGAFAPTRHWRPGTAITITSPFPTWTHNFADSPFPTLGPGDGGGRVRARVAELPAPHLGRGRAGHRRPGPPPDLARAVPELNTKNPLKMRVFGKNPLK